MVLVGRFQKTILPFVLFLSCVSGTSYASHLKGRLQVFFPREMASVSLADGTTNSGGTFCVAKQGADPTALKTGIDFACGPGQANCGPIQPGQPCYVANNIVAVASYAYNAYYQANQARGATCSFSNTAMLTNSDPSSGSCIFPGSSGSGTSPGGGNGTSPGGGIGTSPGGGGGSGGGSNSTGVPGSPGGSSSPGGLGFAPPLSAYQPTNGDLNGVSMLNVHKLVCLPPLVFLSLLLL